MKRRISNFAEYDAVVAEQKAQFEEVVERTLESLLLYHPRIREIKTDAETSRKRIRRFNLRIMRFLSEIVLEREVAYEEASLETARKELYLELRPQAVRDTLVRQVRENIENLLRVKELPSLPSARAQYRKEMYARFVDQLRVLSEEGKNRTFVRLFPEINDLQVHLPPTEKGDIKKVGKLVQRLARQKYLRSESAATLIKLLTYLKTETNEIGEITSPLAPEAALPGTSPSHQEKTREAGAYTTKEDLGRYLQERFGFDKTMVGQCGSLELSPEQIEQFYGELSGIVGEQYALTLIKRNPLLLTYPQKRVHTKYLSTLEKVLERLAGKNGKLPYRMERHPEHYASLEKALKAKQELFSAFAPASSLPEPAGRFELDDYKNKLLQQTGLDVELARAFTEEKNRLFVGERAYGPFRHFWRNARGKVSARKLAETGEETFQELVRMKVIKSRKGDAYSLNLEIDEIDNPYLREYLRLTLHGDLMRSQEGEVKVNPLLVEELYKG